MRWFFQMDELFIMCSFAFFLRNTYFFNVMLHYVWGKLNFSEMWMLMLLKNCGVKYNFSEMWMLMLKCASAFFGVECLFTHYCPISSNCIPVETHVSERSLIFYTFVCKHGALHLHLHVVALPASVTMSKPPKIT